LSKIFFERAGAPDSTYQTLTKFPRLTLLSLRWSNIGPRQMEIVSHCKALDDLNLSRNGMVNDECVKYLSRLPRLAKLNLSETSVTDSGLAALSKCPNLTLLNLGTSKVTDAGLKQLATLKKLSILDINNTKTTPTGLTPLVALPLTKIVLPSSSLSKNQFARLQKQFPHTNIVVPKLETKDMDINEIMAPSH